MSLGGRCEIAIVGGGLVGAAAALGLSRQGFEVRLIERTAPPQIDGSADDYDLRVYALAPGCIRFLDALGVWNAVRAVRDSPYQAMRVWERSAEQALVFDAAEVRAAQLGSLVESRVLAQALWHALPSGVAHSGCAVRRLTGDDRGVRLQLDDGSTLDAGLLIVAEGRDSALRAQLGIETEAGVYAQTAVVCHVATEKPHRQTALQRFLPTGPLAFLPLADGRSSIVWSSTQAEALLMLDDEDFCRTLGEVSQHALGQISACTRRVQFPLSVQHAETYVAARAVLVGDAAHVVHPLAGQGVNLGLADIEALIATLVEARQQRRDIGGHRVLKRYERARRAEVLDMIAVTDGLYRAFSLPLPGGESLRGLGIAAVNAAGPLKRSLVRRAIGA